MRARPENGGFSLVEVMIAILILGIAVAGLTQGISTALRSTKESQLQSAAALLAAGQIETLRAEGYLTEGETEGDCEEPGLTLYRWRQTVTATKPDGLYEVEVVVENSQSGQAIYELRTMLFEPPATTTLDKSALDKTGAKSKEKARRGRW